MRPFCIIAIITVLAGCKSGRFNWYDRLTAKPTTAELVGTYALQKSDPDASPLIEMGYTDIDCSVELRSDGTFSASKLPGCCLHGWDERAYPFTGGLYSMTGDWAIVKTDSVYDVELVFSSITEHTGLVISDPSLAEERKPSATLNVALIDGSPIDLGFQVFDGDFWSIRLACSAQPTKKQNKSEMATPRKPSD